jgi:flagellar biosynthetic protein FlhB
MSGEKTEQPTPKKLQDARKKGQVSKSNDLTQAFLFLTAAGVLSFGGGAYVAELQELMKDFFRPEMLGGELAENELVRRLGQSFGWLLLLSAPLMVSIVMVSAALNFLQVKALFAPEVIKPKFDKLNPINGFKNIFFKPRTYLELLKNLLKFAIVGFLVYKILGNSVRDVILTARVPLNESALVASRLMFQFLFAVGGVSLLVGAADFLLQRRLFMKEMMMSREEVIKEYKEAEGDPHVKHSRRQLHEELLSHSMIQNVPKAKVVVVNPTHLAVALQYEEETMESPRVTAKGQNTVAAKIVELAKKHQVPVMQNIGLARSLYEIEVGRDIPEDLYEAVAEVLNFVYQLAQEEAARKG